MKILFVHQNFPGQYLHLAPALAREGHQVVALSSRTGVSLPGVKIVNYEVPQGRAPGTHPFLPPVEDAVIRGDRVADCALRLKAQGFDPDVVCVHPGWGEGLYLRDVWNAVPQLHYCEFFFRAFQGPTQFRPRDPVTPNQVFQVRTRSALPLLSLNDCDAGVTPTLWQHAQFPPEYRPRIAVVHEGVNMRLCQPDPAAVITLPSGRQLSRADRVVTYVSRNLEPTRGFPEFMRAVARLQKRQPDADIVIIGGDEVSYGASPQGGGTWRERLLREVDVDPNRLHFLGKVPYPVYLATLQISTVHVYLTVPFVLSWSLLEAMAVGCLVVGSSTEPVREVVEHGVNGMLVDFFDVGGLAETIDAGLNGGPAFDAIRLAARRTVEERYSLARCLPRHVELVGAVASRGRISG